MYAGALHSDLTGLLSLEVLYCAAQDGACSADQVGKLVVNLLPKETVKCIGTNLLGLF